MFSLLDVKLYGYGIGLCLRLVAQDYAVRSIAAEVGVVRLLIRALGATAIVLAKYKVAHLRSGEAADINC